MENMIINCNTFGLGYNSKGEYKTTINGKFTKCYNTWRAMLERCYSSRLHEKYSTYIDCQVCDQWLDYQNFAEWWENNYYEIKGQRIALDKDILVKGNKIYSPNTCVFVPSKINSLFVKRDKMRGELPIGVTKRKNGYQAYCANGNGKNITLGTFDNPHEAFLIYKLNKELLIQGMANEYKDEIPSKLYDAMMVYEVEEWD